MDNGKKLTRWDRVRIAWLLKRIKWGQFWHDRIPREIAWRLPRVIVKWAVVRAAVVAAGHDKNPTECTYLDMVDPFDDYPYNKAQRKARKEARAAGL